jgi:hypothetical protein
MKFGTAIIIFFVAIIALVAEFILYMIFGIGAAFSGSMSSLAGTAFFFVTLMVLTITTAVLAPICSIIELVLNKILDIKKLKSKKQNKFQELFFRDIGTSLLVIFLTLILILMIVFGSVGMKEVNKIDEEKSILDTSDSTVNTETEDIAPKSQDVSEGATLKIYSEEDVKDVVAEAKGMADNTEQKRSFYGKYTIYRGDSYLVMFTPYANTVGVIVGAIEKYDEYTLDDVRTLISGDNIYTTAFNIPTSEYMSSWDTSDIRAVIEDDDGNICRGKIDNVDSEMGEMDDNFNYNYVNSISATFNCFSDMHDKNVDFIYIAGNTKVIFDVDMTQYK